jgi:hypothetical protein
MIAHNDPRLIALLSSYRSLLGEELCSPKDLFDAPFVVLAHGIEDLPVLFYGNRMALELWEQDFDHFTKMPSQNTAEPDLREAREVLLKEVATRGFSTGYSGVRVSFTGKRFEIQRATVWNIVDHRQQRIGQAATFTSFRRL